MNTEIRIAIELENITRSYQVGETSLQVLKNINLKIEVGEFVAVMGPSGSGKSTLMQIMGLLDRPTSGVYRLLGKDVAKLTDDEGAMFRSVTIGFIFQMFNLLPRTSALDNVMLPLIYSGQNSREVRARELLKEVGLGDRLDHKPNQLSGGQQQRVAIARALVNRPQIIFADEPTGNLASDQAEDILRWLALLNQQGITVVMVTHDPDIAAHARRAIHIKDGKIEGDELNKNPGPSPQSTGLSFSGNWGLETATAEAGAPSFSLAELKEHIGSALRATAANKVRSGLSVLGILIGVAAVITMLAIGAGAQKAIEARLQSLGSNMVMVFAGAPSTRGVRGSAGNLSRLTLGDADAMKKIRNVQDIYPEVEGNLRIAYRDQNTVVEVQGVSPSYEGIRNAAPYFGRFFTDKENLSDDRVILLGQTVVDRLFAQVNPVGKAVKVGRVDFRVIGILPIKGSTGFSDQDEICVIPIRTGMTRVFGTVYLHEMGVQCASPDAIPLMMEDIERLLRKRHRLSALQEDDFTIRNNAQAQATLSDTTRTFSTLLGIVAAISLLVGGVGIMNIMLVSVNERTREIGLRKAVGAARRAILIQFLLEACLLSIIGGVAGMMIGVSVSLLLSWLAGWAALVTPQAIGLGIAFSMSVGVIFGFWPAYKASLLSPIEALRYE